MARVLLLGLGPLLRPGVRHLGGQCLRTWHFARPLLEAGHDVVLVTTSVGRLDTEAAPGADPLVAEEYDGFPCRSFATHDQARQVGRLERLLAEEGPFEALVAVNTYPAQLASFLATRLPVWADLNGWVMAEAQVLARRERGEGHLRWAWRQERAAVWRADRISVVSEAQRHATLGELAALGRLGIDLADPDTVVVVPNAAAPPHAAVGREREAAGDWPGREGVAEGGEAAVWALWSGGFNTWTNVAALTEGLDAAFARVPALRLAVTGGAIEGYHDASYAAFRAWAEATPHAGRVRLLGWLPTEEMLAWFRRAAIGVNFDARSLEATFGARNRLTNMAASGLAIVSSRGTEVARDLEEAGAGWWFAPDDATGFAEALGAAARSPELGARARRAFAFATTRYADVRTVAPLLEWLASPRPAGDHARRQQATPHERDWQWVALHDLQRHEMTWPHEDAEGLRAAARDLALLRARWPLRVLRWARRLAAGGRRRP